MKLDAVRELVELIAAERGGLPGATCADEPDDEPTSTRGDGKPDPLTFGHIRRAVAELEAIDRRHARLRRFVRNI